MSRKTLPAWQQVVLTALRNVPGADNGHDAWEKLNAGEQAAVMEFLSEHCGEEAPARLEENCGKIKHPRWWVLFWVIFGLLLFVVVGAMLVIRLQEKLDVRITPYLWLVMCPLYMHTAWQGNPAGKTQQMWKKHIENREGTAMALNDMHRAYTAPRKERMNKAMFVFWLVMWLLWIGSLLLEHLRK